MTKKILPNIYNVIYMHNNVFYIYSVFFLLRDVNNSNDISIIIIIKNDTFYGPSDE